jgi:hypothetical protein
MHEHGAWPFLLTLPPHRIARRVLDLDPCLRWTAAIRRIALLDRGWGKPKTNNTHEVKGEIKVVLRKMLEEDGDE